ncbi:hypothetical protein WMY93_011153 [Mugilogobius chulae]|uniref:Uncharacterized protein n=1 Tax=Mugilogobius chulae TaxID=88201 RepID=A0AAW0P562_9GOBI
MASPKLVKELSLCFCVSKSGGDWLASFAPVWKKSPFSEKQLKIRVPRESRGKELVLLVGDSHLRAFVQRHVDIRADGPYSFGFICSPGGTARSLEIDVRNAAVNRRVSKCVLLATGNDTCSRGQTLKKARGDFHDLLKAVTRLCPKTCVVDFPPRHNHVSVAKQNRFRRAYQVETELANLQYVSCVEEFPMNNLQLWAHDATHLSHPDGMQVLTDLICKAIRILSVVEPAPPSPERPALSLPASPRSPDVVVSCRTSRAVSYLPRPPKTDAEEDPKEPSIFGKEQGDPTRSCCAKAAKETEESAAGLEKTTSPTSSWQPRVLVKRLKTEVAVPSRPAVNTVTTKPQDQPMQTDDVPVSPTAPVCKEAKVTLQPVEPTVKRTFIAADHSTTDHTAVPVKAKAVAVTPRPTEVKSDVAVMTSNKFAEKTTTWADKVKSPPTSTCAKVPLTSDWNPYIVVKKLKTKKIVRPMVNTSSTTVKTGSTIQQNHQVQSDMTMMTSGTGASKTNATSKTEKVPVKRASCGSCKPVVKLQRLSHEDCKAKAPEASSAENQAPVVQLQRLQHEDNKAKSSHLENIVGSFHQAEAIFSAESRGRQCTANALAAIVRHTHIRNVHEWSQEDLNMSLIEGDRLYKGKTSRITEESDFLGAFDFGTTETLFEQTFSLNIGCVMGCLHSVSSEQESCGYVTLRDALSQQLATDNACFFTMCGTTCAIIAKNGMYAFVDSHARSKSGMVDGRGKSVVVFLESLGEVQDHINQLASGFGAGNAEFELSSVAVSLNVVFSHKSESKHVSADVVTVESESDCESDREGEHVVVTMESEFERDSGNVSAEVVAMESECESEPVSADVVVMESENECNVECVSVSAEVVAMETENESVSDGVTVVGSVNETECERMTEMMAVDSFSEGEIECVSVKVESPTVIALNTNSTGSKAWDTRSSTKGNVPEVGHKRGRTENDSLVSPLAKKNRKANKRKRAKAALNSTTSPNSQGVNKAKVFDADDIFPVGCSENVLQFSPLSENVCKAVCDLLTVEFENCHVKQPIHAGDVGVPCENESIVEDIQLEDKQTEEESNANTNKGTSPDEEEDETLHDRQNHGIYQDSCSMPVDIEPLGKINDFWYRIEYQQRGSPHVHVFLFGDGPEIGKNTDEEHSQRHSKTCRKKNTVCRFNFPRPVSQRTFITRRKEKPKCPKCQGDTASKSQEGNEVECICSQSYEEMCEATCLLYNFMLATERCSRFISGRGICATAVYRIITSFTGLPHNGSFKSHKQT